MRATFLVQQHGDRAAPEPPDVEVEHLAHRGGLVRIRLQPLALAGGDGPVPEGQATAIPEAVPRVFHHRPQRIGRHLAAVVLVENLQHGFHHPARVGFVVEVDADVDHAAPGALQFLLVERGVQLVAGKARRAPADEIIHLVDPAIRDRIPERRPLVSPPGYAIVPEHLQHIDVQRFRLAMPTLDLALDRQSLVGLLDRTHPGVDHSRFSTHRAILFLIS
ncbi:MAG: hypothetical protein ABIK08_08125 [Pseudomonadota bacterium]